MNIKLLNIIIPMVSVGVMIVWGTLAKDYQHSGLAVFVGGILVAVINVLGRKDKNDNDDKDE